MPKCINVPSTNGQSNLYKVTDALYAEFTKLFQGYGIQYLPIILPDPEYDIIEISYDPSHDKSHYDYKWGGEIYDNPYRFVTFHSSSNFSMHTPEMRNDKWYACAYTIEEAMKLAKDAYLNS